MTEKLNDVSSIHMDENKEGHSVTNTQDEDDIAVTWKSYIAVLGFMLLQVAQVWSLFGAAFLATSMATYLERVDLVHWIPITTSLGQAVFAPLFSNASDIYGYRKLFIGIPSAVAVIGAIVTGTSTSMSTCLLGQAFTSVGLGTTALGYSAPSEMIPRRWRSMVQALLNVGAIAGGLASIMTAGHLLEIDPSTGWRTSYYVQTALGASSLIFFILTYTPVKQIKKNESTLKENLHKIDVLGISLLASGLLLLILGISLGGNPNPWSSAQPLGCIIVGFVLLCVFGAWEKKRGDGILPVAMFVNRNFAISIVGIFLEGIILFGVVIFYPVQTTALWDAAPLNVSLRTASFFLPTAVLAVPIGYISSRFFAFKSILVFGFVCYLGGLIGMITAGAETTMLPILYGFLLGIGFAPILILLVSVAQLSTPPPLIGTTSAVLVSTRAVGAAICPAFLGAILTAKLATNIPDAIIAAVVPLGLPLSSLPAFIGAVLAKDVPALMKVPGVTKPMIGAAVAAVPGALADSFKWIWITLVPFAAAGAILMLFLSSENLKAAMTAHVDAPMEQLEFQGNEA